MSMPLVLGDEVLEVEGGFSFDITVKAVHMKQTKLVDLQVNPRDRGADLERKLAAALTLEPPLYMVLASSGSMEEPGKIEVIQRSHSFEELAGSFCSLMVLVDAEAECEMPYSLRAQVPLGQYLKDKQFADKIQDINLVVPCAGDATLLCVESLVAFVLGLLPSSASDLKEPAIRLSAAGEEQSLDPEQTVESLCARQEALTCDVVCRFPEGGTALAQLAECEKRLAWDLEGY